MDRQRVTLPVKSAGTGEVRTFTISSGVEDRDGDVLEPSGIVTTHYLKNPVVLWAHDYDQPPIGRTRSIGATVDQRLEADVEFAPTPFASEIKHLVDAGFIRAASVGFTPITYEPRPGTGRRYTRWELLEWSLVTVPSNPQALLVEAKAKGLHLPTVERTLTATTLIRLPWWATRDALRHMVTDAVRVELERLKRS